MEAVPEQGTHLQALNEELAEAQRDMLAADSKAEKRILSKRCDELDQLIMVEHAQYRADEARSSDMAAASGVFPKEPPRFDADVVGPMDDATFIEDCVEYFQREVNLLESNAPVVDDDDLTWMDDSWDDNSKPYRPGGGSGLGIGSGYNSIAPNAQLAQAGILRQFPHLLDMPIDEDSALPTAPPRSISQNSALEADYTETILEYDPKIGAALDAIVADDLEGFKKAMLTIHVGELVFASGEDAVIARKELGLSNPCCAACTTGSLARRNLSGEIGQSLLLVAKQSIRDSAWIMEPWLWTTYLNQPKMLTEMPVYESVKSYSPASTTKEARSISEAAQAMLQQNSALRDNVRASLQKRRKSKTGGQPQTGGQPKTGGKWVKRKHKKRLTMMRNIGQTDVASLLGGPLLGAAAELSIGANLEEEVATGESMYNSHRAQIEQHAAAEATKVAAEVEASDVYVQREPAVVAMPATQEDERFRLQALNEELSVAQRDMLSAGSKAEKRKLRLRCNELDEIIQAEHLQYRSLSRSASFASPELGAKSGAVDMVSALLDGDADNQVGEEDVSYPHYTAVVAEPVVEKEVVVVAEPVDEEEAAEEEEEAAAAAEEESSVTKANEDAAAEAAAAEEAKQAEEEAAAAEAAKLKAEEEAVAAEEAARAKAEEEQVAAEEAARINREEEAVAAEEAARAKAEEEQVAAEEAARAKAEEEAAATATAEEAAMIKAEEEAAADEEARIKTEEEVAAIARPAAKPAPAKTPARAPAKTPAKPAVAKTPARVPAKPSAKPVAKPAVARVPAKTPAGIKKPAARPATTADKPTVAKVPAKTPAGVKKKPATKPGAKPVAKPTTRSRAGSMGSSSANPEIDLGATVRAFFEANNPSKLESLDKLVSGYEGRETTLVEQLEEKYGVPVPLITRQGTSLSPRASQPKKKLSLSQPRQ